MFSENEPAHEESPPGESVDPALVQNTTEPAPKSSNEEGLVSFRDFARDKGVSFAEAKGHLFPLLNALRVHMRIAHHDDDLRPESEFQAKLAELMGE